MRLNQIRESDRVNIKDIMLIEYPEPKETVYEWYKRKTQEKSDQNILKYGTKTFRGRYRLLMLQTKDNAAVAQSVELESEKL